MTTADDIISMTKRNYVEQFAQPEPDPCFNAAEQGERHRAVPLAVREFAIESGGTAGICPHGQLRRQCELCSANATIAEFRALLNECLEYLEPLQDVRDGSYGAQEPNKEMSLCTAIRLAFGESPL